MKLEDYKDLESRGAIMVNAADLLAWREEMADHEALNINCSQYHSEVERLRQVKLWGRRVYGWLRAMAENNMLHPGGAPEQFYKSAPAEVLGK